MRRRDFVAFLVCGTTWPLHAYAQPQKIPRIGALLPGTPASFSLRTKAFREGLREHGYVEGRTVEIEWKWGQDRVDALPELAAELARSNVDVMVTGGTSAAKALKAATRTIPIVMAIVSDPVAAGLGGQPCTAWRKRHRLQHCCSGTRDKASGIAERDCADGLVDSSSAEHQQSAVKSRTERDADGSSGHGTAASSGRNFD